VLLAVLALLLPGSAALADDASHQPNRKSCGDFKRGSATYELEFRKTSCFRARLVMRSALRTVLGRSSGRGKRRTVRGWKCRNVDSGFAPDHTIVECMRGTYRQGPYIRIAYKDDTER